jgi:hypothetical protein
MTSRERASTCGLLYPQLVSSPCARIINRAVFSTQMQVCLRDVADSLLALHRPNWMGRLDLSSLERVVKVTVVFRFSSLMSVGAMPI